MEEESDRDELVEEKKGREHTHTQKMGAERRAGAWEREMKCGRRRMWEEERRLSGNKRNDCREMMRETAVLCGDTLALRNTDSS